ARSPQEEELDELNNPDGLNNGAGDSIWLSKTRPGDILDAMPSDFQHTVTVDGVPTQVDDRSIVLHFTPGNWKVDQAVYVYAPEDNRAEGDRVVVTQHSVISGDANFDGVDVRNVEVTVHDDDTPGISIKQVQKGTTIEDGRTLVIEGDASTEQTD